MICPVCKHIGARRSRRQSAADYILSLAGVYPWRCTGCRTRFHARMMGLSDSLHAHCPICGNPELKRIAPEHVHTALSPIWRAFHLPALRCEPCRHKFFTMLPQRQFEETAELSSAD